MLFLPDELFGGLNPSSSVILKEPPLLAFARKQWGRLKNLAQDDITANYFVISVVIPTSKTYLLHKDITEYILG
jgi:hypothetical protein